MAPPPDHVFALRDGTLSAGDELVRIEAGQTWAADEPVVQANPDAFSDSPPFVHRNSGGIPRREVPAPVEQATAAPGERRTTRRRR